RRGARMKPRLTHLALGEPDDPAAILRPLVNDVQVHVLAVEGDGAVEVADAERQVGEPGLHAGAPAMRAASASARPRRSSGSSQPAAAACPPPPRLAASRERSTVQSGERRRLTARLLAS